MQDKYLGIVHTKNVGDIPFFTVGIYSYQDHKTQDYEQVAEFGRAISVLCRYISKAPELIEQEISTGLLSSDQEEAIKSVRKLFLEQRVLTQ